LDPQVAARQYTEEIQNFFRLEQGVLPSFDLLHLGLGSDGHTASLFPGGPLIEDRTNVASAVYVEKLKTWRITLLPGALLAAREILFFTGPDKAEVIETVVHGAYDPLRWPSQVVIRNAANIVWFTGSGTKEP
jgi:6-phosphogluconolactonase